MMLQDSILRSRLPITLIKNEWLLRVHIWIFGEIGVEKRFVQKTACPDMVTYLPNFGKKNHRIRDLEGFGRGLEHPNIW